MKDNGSSQGMGATVTTIVAMTRGRHLRRRIAVVGAVVLVASLLSTGIANAGPTCFRSPVTIIGTSGDDIIVGTAGPDVIMGLLGHDEIRGGAGSDLICGGDQRDMVYGDEGDDKVAGARGSDFVSGGDGNDRVYGGGWRDSFTDTMVGGAGDDLLSGNDAGGGVASYIDSPGPISADLSTGTATGEGTDTLVNVNTIDGSEYDDTLTNGALASGRFSSVNGNGGADSLYSGTAVTGGLFGDGGNDLLVGNEFDDSLHGGDGADVIRGNEGDDSIWGDEGTTWNPNGGNDVMFGGSGDDRFDMAGPGDAGNDEYYGGDGTDSIRANDGSTSNDLVDGGEGPGDICGADAGDAVVNCEVVLPE